MILFINRAPAVAQPTMQEGLAWVKDHSLSEEEFIRLSKEPGTVILDDSSQEDYKLLHIANALNWDRARTKMEDLESMLPDKNVRILIYDNNNYRTVHRHNALRAVPGTSEIHSRLQNAAAYLQLREHGYASIYALAAYVLIDHSGLPLAANIPSIDLRQPVTLSLISEAAPPVFKLVPTHARF